MRACTYSNILKHVSCLTFNVGILLPVHSPPPQDYGEQMGSLPCVLRLSERETSESCQMA